MRIHFLLALLVSVFAQPAAPREWSQWRGPARDGAVPAASVPAQWPADYGEKWKLPNLGEGYASPVVSNGRVFVHSRKDPQEVVTAVDLAAGTIAWQHNYDAAFTKNQYAVKMAKGPNATPLATGGRLFTLGVTGMLTAWDAASGKQLWQKNFSPTIDTSKLFCGTAASPILVNGLVVVQVGSDVHGGQILALDPATGAQQWEWKGAGPGYASPVLIDVAGTPQIVTMTNSSIVGVDAKTGKGLWSTPFPDEWHENIVTPTWTGSHLVVSGTRQGTHGYTLAQSGGAWTATKAWSNADVTMYMSSPVLADGVIYGLTAKRRGAFVALDAKTGALKWQTEGREGEHASMLLTPRHVVYLTNGGSLVVARRNGEKFDLEKKYQVGSAETWAVPVVLGNDLIVRDATGLARLTGK